MMKEEMTVQETWELSIEGMHCGACVRRVTNALEAMHEVQVASVEVGSARIAVDPAKTSAEEIAAAIGRIGFSVRIDR
jgi:copper chaperone